MASSPGKEMNSKDSVSVERSFKWTSRLANRLYSRWILWTYPFASMGSHLSAHHTCDISRTVASRIKIGNSVRLDREVWLNIADFPKNDEPVIILDDGCQIGDGTILSAKNRIHIGRNSVLGPGILLVDHNHTYEDINVPISHQGITAGGTIQIEEGCQIGFGAVIICNQGELVVGKNSVVCENSVLSQSIPSDSVVSGNPARPVKKSDQVERNDAPRSGEFAKQV
jgi:acetyltransferase-like isoleucine patch superfamily enzyme